MENRHDVHVCDVIIGDRFEIRGRESHKSKRAHTHIHILTLLILFVTICVKLTHRSKEISCLILFCQFIEVEPFMKF